MPGTGRIASCPPPGDWSGNLYDFYCRVSQRLAEDAPPAAPVRRALCEALVNCLVNADYCGRQGVVVIRQRDFVSISNPGSFRIEPETVRSGGISDPRNAALFKLFLLINVGEHTGSGVPRLYAAWRSRDGPRPSSPNSSGRTASPCVCLFREMRTSRRQPRRKRSPPPRA